MLINIFGGRIRTLLRENMFKITSGFKQIQQIQQKVEPKKVGKKKNSGKKSVTFFGQKKNSHPKIPLELGLFAGPAIWFWPKMSLGIGSGGGKFKENTILTILGEGFWVISLCFVSYHRGMLMMLNTGQFFCWWDSFIRVLIGIFMYETV